MGTGQRTRANSVFRADRKTLESLPGQMPGEILGQVDRDIQSAETHLGGNFPRRNGTHQDGAFLDPISFRADAGK